MQVTNAAWAAWLLVFVLALRGFGSCGGAPPEPQSAPPGELGAGAGRLLWGLPLDLNHAPAAALETLPGIGSGRAAAIIAARPFCRVADLLRVRGIGQVIFERVRAQLEVARPLPAGCARGANAPRQP